MGIAIHLLGAPHVVRDGTKAEGPKGRKVWALLSYLLLSEARPLRTQLASLLFSEADDPLRALRWNLNAVRHLLGDDATIEGEPVTLRLPVGTFVDALVLPRATWIEAVAIPAFEEELLAGMDFPSATFDTWLRNERRHLRAAAVAALTDGTMARLAAGDASGAVDLATRLTGLDPLDEDHQLLLVRSLTAAGDHKGAQRQISACRALFRSELGVDPGAALQAATAPPVYAPPSTRGAAAIRAQMDAGEAAIRAGAIDVGLAYLRQAAAQSQVVDDDVLQMNALLTMGAEMVHASRGRQQDGATALHRVIVLAQDRGDEEMAARAHHHLAWIDLMAARFAPLQRRLAEADQLRVEDPGVRTWGHIAAGMGAFATARYAEAHEAFQRAIEVAEGTGDARLRSFAASMAAGVHMARGDHGRGRQAAQEALDGGQSATSLSLIGLAAARLGEAETNDRSIKAGHQLLERAMALGDQILESCVQVSAGIQLGLMDVERGDLDTAVSRLHTAWTGPMMLPDHVWKGALALDALCTVAVRERLPQARRWVSDLESLSARTGMRELLTRAYLHRHNLGDDTAEAAALLAAEIDNPLLHNLVTETTGARVGSAPPGVGATSGRSR